MKSLREAARTASANPVRPRPRNIIGIPLPRPIIGIPRPGNGGIVSVRALARRFGMADPISLTALIGVLDAPPPAVAAPLEEVHFHGIVSTPTGTALGGWVDLKLRSDGTYEAHFHLHDSGAADYDYQVRAIFTAANGLAFVAQQSGHVEGHIVGNKNRSDNHIISGSHPFIKDFWPDVKAGSFAVTKEYKPTGVIGAVQDVASFVLDIGTHTIGAGLGVVIGLGREMGQVFGDLGLGSEFGLLAGVVVFASGGTLALALPVGATVGAVTNAMIQQRQMHGDEYAFAATVFGGSLPPRERIWLTNMAGLGGRYFTFPGIDNKNIYLNIGPSFNDPMRAIKGYPKRGQVLIHELTHAWQIQNRTFLPGLLCEDVVTQGHDSFGGSAYAYGPPGRPWGEFGTEQQGAIVDQWFAGMRAQDQTPMDSNDPYFMYIRDNIRQGRP